jgi:hypothetical protein
MSGARRNDPCPCGSGKKYKNCCYDKDYTRANPKTTLVDITLDNGSKMKKRVASLNSLPAYNKNGLAPDITPAEMMDLCLDEILNILRKEKVGMLRDLTDSVILKMDVVPSFTYKQIADRIIADGRFEIAAGQICGLRGTDPLGLMAERLKI